MQHIRAVFDIGNAYTKAIVIAEDKGKTVLLAKTVKKSRWIRKGKIMDRERFMHTIQDIKQGFIKKMGGDFIDEVIIGISHPDMNIQRIDEQKRVMTPTISEDDVHHLSNVVTDITSSHNMETLKIIPVYWLIDENKREKDPVWLEAGKLNLIADVFQIPKNFFTSLMEVFDHLDLRVIDVIPSILWLSESLIDYDQKDLGVLLIDIGNNHSDYVAFEDGYPLLFSTAPMGGEEVTKDISIGLQIDIKEAEEIKKSYQQEWDSENKEIDQAFLEEIVTARYEELFTHINKKLKKIHKDGRLAGGVILTGWGSLLPYTEDLAKEIFQLATYAWQEKILRLGDISDNRSYQACLGLYSRSIKYSVPHKKPFLLKWDMFGNIGKFFKDLF